MDIYVNETLEYGEEDKYVIYTSNQPAHMNGHTCLGELLSNIEYITNNIGDERYCQESIKAVIKELIYTVID